MTRFKASPFEQAYPVFAAIGLTAGDLAGLNGISITFGGVAVALGLLYVGLIYWQMRDLSRVSRWPSDWVWIISVFFGIGVISGSMARPLHYPFSEPDDRAHLVYATVEESELENYGNRLTVDIKGIYDAQSEYTPLSNVKARVLTDAVEYVPGDVILFANHLEPVECMNFPGSRQYIESMHKRGIFYAARFMREKDIQLIEHQSSLREVFSTFRDDIAVIIDRSSLSRGAKGFILAMTTGVKDDITSEMRDTFSRAGIAHILSVSGMHVGIVAVTLWYLMIPLALIVSRKKRMVVVLIGVWIYAALCGMSPPVMRASIMATFLLAAAMLERVGKGFSALCTSVIVILLIDPLAINDVGFQLSVSTVGALVLFMRPLQKLYEGRPYTIRYILSLVLTSLVAVAGSWHITSYYFHTLPLFFIPLNIVIIPLLPAVLFAGFVAILFNYFGCDADWIYSLINMFYSGLENISKLAGAYYIDNLWPHYGGVLLYSLLVIIVSLAIYTSYRKIWIGVSVLTGITAMFMMFMIPVERPSDQLSMGNTFGMLMVRTYTSGEYKTVYPMRGTCSVVRIPDKVNIVAVDCNVEKLLHDIRDIHDCDYVLVGTQFDGALKDLQQKFGNRPIILSSLLSRKREASLARQCSVAKIPYHVVRHSGDFTLECAHLR